MQQILFLIHILSAISLVALILLQHGKGADMGAAFGAGASGTLFGSVGSLPFLTKLTACIAAVFFASCLGLGYVISKEIAKPVDTNIIAPVTQPQTTIPVTSAQSAAPLTPIKSEAEQAAPAPVKKTKKSKSNHQ